MRQVQQEGVRTGAEDPQVAQPLHERPGTEGDPPDWPQRVLRRGGVPTHRPVDHVLPSGQIRLPQPVQPGFVQRLDLRPGTRSGHCRLQRLRHRPPVQTDRVGQRVHRPAGPVPAVAGGRRSVESAAEVVLRAVDPQLQILPDRVRVLAPDQTTTHGPVEDLVGGAEVLAHLVRLAYDVVEEANVRVRLAVEVVHRDVAGLAVAVEATVALLQSRRVPGAVVVKQVARGPVQVQSLGGGVGGDEDPDPGVGIVEGGLHTVAGGGVHAARPPHAEERQDPVLGVAPPQAVGEVVQRGLVLREDDQPLVVAEPVAGAQQLLHERDQPVEARVVGGLALGRRPSLRVESKGLDRTLHPVDLLRELAPVVAEPAAHHGGRRRLSFLGLAVVPGLLPQRALRHADF